MTSLFTITEHVIDGQHIREFPNATATSQEHPLKLAVKQYVPKDNAKPQSGDLTIVAAHACGFPKELYEALWEDLLAQSRRNGFRIKAIWIADCAWQGYSGEINEEHLGNDPSWMDNARDILHMVNHFRAEISLPVVAIGHSFGATTLVNVSVMHPRLFSSIVLIDPVISMQASAGGGVEADTAASSLYRRDLWPSAAAAAASFSKNPFYTTWDKRMLAAWLKHSLRPVPTVKYPVDGQTPAGAVTLRTSLDMEVVTYLRPSWPAFSADGSKLLDRSLVPDLDTSVAPMPQTWPMYRAESSATMAKLPFVRPPVLYVLGETSLISTPDIRSGRLHSTGTGPGGSGGVQAGKVREEVLQGAGHLVAMEKPVECARLAAEWFGKCMPDINRELERFEQWKKKPLKEKITLGKEWTDRVPRLQRSPKTSKI